MKIFKAATGHIFFFGYDVFQRKEDAEIISWSDADGTCPAELSVKSEAGWNVLKVGPIDPQFVYETRNCIIAFQSGACIEISYVGAPFIWTFNVLRASA